MVANAGNPPRNEERFAYAVINRILGVEVQHHDTGAKPAMVDGHFSLADGRTGAVEVTTVSAGKALEIEAVVPKWKLDIPGLQWAWHINVGSGVRRAAACRHLELLIPRCEQQGVRHIENMIPLPDLLDSYTWCIDSDIEAFGTPETSFPGRIYMAPGTSSGGAVPDGLDGFPAWLIAQLATDRFAGDLAKLKQSGRQEQHLSFASTRRGFRLDTSTTSRGNPRCRPNNSTRRLDSPGCGWGRVGNGRFCAGPPMMVGAGPTTNE